MHTISRPPSIHGPGHGLGMDLGWLAGGPTRFAARALATLLTWQERAAQRHALRRLDDRMLADIALSRADVEREASKPFWRA